MDVFPKGFSSMKYGMVSKACLALVLLSATSCLSGCDPAQEDETFSALQSALTSLTQNRGLTEQFVRDIKATVDPSDPAYLQAMESYQDARDIYNRYLDQVESGRKAAATRSLRDATPLKVENATADFLEDATRALKPAVNTRRIKFQRAVVIPETLQRDLAIVPKKERDRMVDRFDDQVRWRSWSDM